MQAAGGDAAEEGADVAAESAPGAVAHEQADERGAQHLAPRQPPGRIETAGEAGGRKGAGDDAEVPGRRGGGGTRAGPRAAGTRPVPTGSKGLEPGEGSVGSG